MDTYKKVINHKILVILYEKITAKFIKCSKNNIEKLNFNGE